jgi:hypothetical protein
VIAVDNAQGACLVVVALGVAYTRSVESRMVDVI